MRLSLGVSPCPNDTYIFGGLALGLVKSPLFELDVFLADVEQLNARALAGEPDVCKVSAHALPGLLGEYQVLRCGGAVVRGAGPLLVAREPLGAAQLKDAVIAIPGERTTANLLLSLTGLHQGERRPMIFSRVMDAVLAGEVDAGLIIHEGRFTYAARGLHLVLDLGKWWEGQTRLPLPLPLGVIVMRRSLGLDAAWSMERAIRESLDMATQGSEAVEAFVAQHAQEMDPEVMAKHIATFVDEHSRDLGGEGQAAVWELARRAVELEGGTLPDRILVPEQERR